MVCVFVWQRRDGTVTISEVLAARNRDELEAHLDRLLREAHPMAMRYEESFQFEYSNDFGEDLHYDFWSNSNGSSFIMQDFPKVHVPSDGRVWVVPMTVEIHKSLTACSVFTDKRPDPVEGEGEVFEVFILGTQLSKSASKT
jgi:hypothetical protein